MRARCPTPRLFKENIQKSVSDVEFDPVFCQVMRDLTHLRVRVMVMSADPIHSFFHKIKLEKSNSAEWCICQESRCYCLRKCLQRCGKRALTTFDATFRRMAIRAESLTHPAMHARVSQLISGQHDLRTAVLLNDAPPPRVVPGM